MQEQTVEQPSETVTDDDGENEPDVHGHDDEHGEVMQCEAEAVHDGAEELGDKGDIGLNESAGLIYLCELGQDGGENGEEEAEDECSEESSCGSKQGALEKYMEACGACEKEGRHQMSSIVVSGHIGHIGHIGHVLMDGGCDIHIGEGVGATRRERVSVVGVGGGCEGCGTRGEG